MKVMVVGSGGREHALVWKISQSKRVEKIYALPGNAGMANLAEAVDIKESSIIEIADFAQREKVDLTIVGPELSLSLGIVDEFKKRNMRIFGPSQIAATIESSKAFSKAFMKKHGIPTADFALFNDAAQAMTHLSTAEYPLVIKVDGLAGGKGVFICQGRAEAEDAIRTTMLENKFGKAGDSVVIEQFLVGQEMSFMVIADGKRAVPLVTAMDYKKIFEKNQGPNTGGMGAISPAPQINGALIDEVMKTVIYPTLEGMKTEGKEFRGVLYAGLMLTSKGPKVLEFNARFGDPETQTVLMRLKTDLIDLLEAAADGALYDVPVEWSEETSACVVLASKGYPGKYETGKKIIGLERAMTQGVVIFHAGTTKSPDGFISAGGRVMNICATGPTLKAAMSKIYDAISFISFDNITFRQDIGRNS
jgi:phosphoribosylamine--glycine ligase